MRRDSDANHEINFDHEYERRELENELTSNQEDAARSDEDGWYYDDGP